MIKEQNQPSLTHIMSHLQSDQINDHASSLLQNFFNSDTYGITNSSSLEQQESSEEGIQQLSLHETLTTEPQVLSTLQLKNRREIGCYAQWILSSAKANNGVRQLQNPDTSVFWQSDGQYPHIVTLQFPKKYHIYGVALYLDYATDESYTPLEIDVLVGTNERDVELVCFPFIFFLSFIHSLDPIFEQTVK